MKRRMRQSGFAHPSNLYVLSWANEHKVGSKGAASQAAGISLWSSHTRGLWCSNHSVQWATSFAKPGICPVLIVICSVILFPVNSNKSKSFISLQAVQLKIHYKCFCLLLLRGLSDSKQEGHTPFSLFMTVLTLSFWQEFLQRLSKESGSYPF